MALAREPPLERLVRQTGATLKEALKQQNLGSAAFVSLSDALVSSSGPEKETKVCERSFRVGSASTSGCNDACKKKLGRERDVCCLDQKDIRCLLIGLNRSEMQSMNSPRGDSREFFTKETPFFPLQFLPLTTP